MVGFYDISQWKRFLEYLTKFLSLARAVLNLKFFDIFNSNEYIKIWDCMISYKHGVEEMYLICLLVLMVYFYDANIGRGSNFTCMLLY